MLNEYNNISGGTLFDFFDKKAHELAKIILGPCVTSSAEVKYLRPCKEIDGYTINEINTTMSSVIIVVTSSYFYGIFTFIKLKNENKV